MGVLQRFERRIEDLVNGPSPGPSRPRSSRWRSPAPSSASATTGPRSCARAHDRAQRLHRRARRARPRAARALRRPAGAELADIVQRARRGAGLLLHRPRHRGLRAGAETCTPACSGCAPTRWPAPSDTSPRDRRRRHAACLDVNGTRFPLTAPGRRDRPRHRRRPAHRRPRRLPPARGGAGARATAASSASSTSARPTASGRRRSGSTARALRDGAELHRRHHHGPVPRGGPAGAEAPDVRHLPAHPHGHQARLPRRALALRPHRRLGHALGPVRHAASSSAAPPAARRASPPTAKPAKPPKPARKGPPKTLVVTAGRARRAPRCASATPPSPSAAPRTPRSCSTTTTPPAGTRASSRRTAVVRRGPRLHQRHLPRPHEGRAPMPVPVGTPVRIGKTVLELRR